MKFNLSILQPKSDKFVDSDKFGLLFTFIPNPIIAFSPCDWHKIPPNFCHQLIDH